MSIKILVADDSITIQKVIGIIFGGDEYSLTVVDNGKAAVEKAREITPDILLIDALMPGMTGYEASEIIRATPALATKPILILTGSFEPFDEEKAKTCGADDFIAKPFESQQIIAKVKELLELGNSRATQAAPIPTPPPVVEIPVTQAPVIPAAPPIAPAPAVAIPQPEVPSDIWGAFTPEAEEPAAPAIAAPSPVVPPLASPAAAVEPDVFAIVLEEDDAQLVKTAAPANSSPQHTGSQWIPVEENTFEFEEETVAQPPQATFSEQAITIQEPSFGDISFEDDVATPAEPAFTPAPEPKFTAPAFADFTAPAPVFEAPVAPPEPFAPLADPTPAFATFSEPAAPIEPAVTIAPVAAAPVIPAPSFSQAAPAELTEEQLRIALTTVSKDVIERIVWEVVPELAETLIREAIRKIKEGV
jgi:CheY-like chemotaxis protein